MKKLDAFFSRLLDRISDYIAAHRGMPILLAVLLVVLNYVLRVIPDTQLGFVESTDLLLHLGVLIGLLGVLLGDAL
jgi:TRAP-type mannitol/chloroaromatic compound transport system permease small subunit